MGLAIHDTAYETSRVLEDDGLVDTVLQSVVYVLCQGIDTTESRLEDQRYFVSGRSEIDLDWELDRRGVVDLFV